MSAKNEVQREDFYWGYILKGTKDALVATGCAKEDWFPSGQRRDKRGRVVRTICLKHDGRNVRCTWGRDSLFHLRFSYSEDEMGHFEAKQRFKLALAEEEKELRAMPNSHEEYRSRCSRVVSEMCQQIASHYCGAGKWHGYSYGPETFDALAMKVQEIRNLLETGRTSFSKSVHDRRIAEIRSQTSEADSEYSRFKRAALGG